MEKCIIVAISDNNAIGRGGDMPWHIAEDLKYFKNVTSGHPVIMGRRTFESIGRPLPKRTNIVITRGDAAPEGTLLAHSLEEAFDLACGHAWLDQASHHSEQSVMANDEIPCQARDDHQCFVIGGGQIYAQAMPLADVLYITHIHTVVEDADTFFPAIDPEVWTAVSCSEMKTDPETGYQFEFVVYRRI